MKAVSLLFSVVFLALSVTAELEGSVCEVSGSLYPHPECSKCYLCDNGILLVLDCPDGTWFNPIESYCDFPANVEGCEGGTRPPVNGTTTTVVTPPRNTTTTAAPPTAEPEPESTTAGNTNGTTTLSTNYTITTPSWNNTTPSLNVTTPSWNITTPSLNVTTPSWNITTPSLNVTTPSWNITTPSLNVTTPSWNITTPSLNVTTPSWNATEATTAGSRICVNEEEIYTVPGANCSLYTFCLYGEALEETCPNGTIFDQPAVGGIGSCVLDTGNKCQGGEAPLCSSDDKGFKPYPGNCTLYIVCANGQGTVLACGQGTLFDPVLEQCNVASEVKCEGDAGGNSTISSISAKHVAAKAQPPQEEPTNGNGAQGFFSRIFG